MSRASIDRGGCGRTSPAQRVTTAAATAATALHWRLTPLAACILPRPPGLSCSEDLVGAVQSLHFA